MQKGFLKSLTIIYTALLIGASLFSAFAVSMPQLPRHYNLDGLDLPLLSVAGFLFVSSQGIAAYLFNQRLQVARNTPDSDSKLNIYRAAFIVKMALLEGPVMFASVTTLITGNVLGTGLAVLGLLSMLFQKPGITGIADALNLSREERLQLENE